MSSNVDQDAVLMTRLQAGDETVVADIGTRYGTELRLFCQRMVYNEAMAEDIVQDVLMTCCRHDAGAKPSGSLRGWLYRVTRNRAIDEIRRKHPNVRLSVLGTKDAMWSDSAIPLDPVTTPAGKAIKEDRARRVKMAIDAMDEDLREVVILYFFQGLAREQVAEAIGLTLSGTKARLAKATRILREQLAGLNDSSL
ncbi:MAG: RNA polymerase sigma factor [Planctomycetes bacterium]|nr:RNA polymerase sigma factor [Planctomycetota bacterium]